MTGSFLTRRTLLSTGLATGTAAALGGLSVPARAAGLAPTPTMRGGANNYRPGAPIVERIGGGGFWMTGTVRRAGDGAPLPGRRIQMWAHTTEGHERDPESHGATLTDANGMFRLEMPQIVPAFGQPHGHLAYDADHDTGHGGGGFKTVFLRPIMGSAEDTTLDVAFVLEPV
ncbi:Twin-arginine translocation pathway signal [Dinoroseobacter sp. PD6]|uniref:Twin-arginine translocation pathway signal n=1 Tax=Dinoroseobacter sp. PD6 TaxID=3028384 RepID=UPI00237C4E54|nr:Twin-arginine translocation pathway signal [Dinoroseobacter sp. PD6]MDD9715158.1 Twin-arginine translocation pathway signal [Dinoroseobacter sp. PD6]